jgi:hypothetical protein
MSILADLKMYSRFAWGLRGYLRHTISLDEAKAIIRKRMAERETNFLRLVKKGIFGYPKSPYIPLLKLARCEMGDIEKMVRDKGLEGTLRALREAGVYVSFEEFKGREPIVRNGQVFHIREHDFDNPYLKYYYEGQSGGTTGAGTRVAIDLDHSAAIAPYTMLAQDAYGILDVPMAIWLGVLPDDSGVRSCLLRARFRNIPRKWFSFITKQDFRPSLKNRLATQCIVVVGRFYGVPIPWPEALPLDQANTVARWATETLKSHPACLIVTHVSIALRICLAARNEGLDLSGTVIWGGGEPPTAAKVKEITQVGARWIPHYQWTESGGPVGLGCACPVDINDLHFFKDSLALIQYPRQVPGSEITVNAFHFTTLLPTAPKLMLNVESDDYGIIERRSCGCLLEAYGFTEHLRDIHSFRKLTGEGVTLVGSEMVYILEEVLPAHFGGSPLDYQLLEEEDEKGFTRLSLIISPKIEIREEKEAIEVVLEALKRSSVSAGLAQAMWSQTGTLRVKRMEPILTARSKLMTLHLSQRPEHKVAQGGGK